MKKLVISVIVVLCAGVGVISLLVVNSKKTGENIDEKFPTDKVIAHITHIIQGDKLESDYVNSEFEFYNADVISSFDISSYYVCDNAYYIEIAGKETKYMFRFQLGTDGKIMSYIKYILEA
jgi:hypothetical protein